MTLVLPLCLAVVGALFASVGQAGAPGYVAVMGLFGYGPAAIKATALALTTLVATIGVIGFHRAGLLQDRATGCPSRSWAFRFRLSAG